MEIKKTLPAQFGYGLPPIIDAPPRIFLKERLVVMVYKDAEGWLYKVMPTEKGYQTHCKRDREWVAFFLFRPKETETEAQAELDEHAAEEGWVKVDD